MNKSPAFQFYPNDWLSSPKIAMMTPAQEGAYIRLLCYCWASGDCTLPSDDNALLSLSRLNNIEDLRVVLKCFNQCSTDGAKITNKRLILEAKKQQSWREKSSKGGKQASENKKKFKGGTEMVATKSKPSSSFSSSSSSSKNNNINIDFDVFWKAYPHKVGKGDAVKAFNTAIKKTSIDEILKAIQRYIQTKPPDRPYCNPSTWLNQERWNDEPSKPTTIWQAKPLEQRTGVKTL